MERKIGEIFECNGEWYQCVKSSDGSCKQCDMNFGGKCPIPIKECTASDRSDKSYIVFKKLEKVGEPYMAHDHSRNKDVVVQDYKLYNQHACYNGHEEMLVFGLHGRVGMVTIKSKEPIKSLNCENSVEIEIKQNKEDMKTVKISKDDLNFLVNKIRYGILPKHTTYDEITDEISNLFSVDDTKHSNSESIGKNLKPFDLQAAKSGKPIRTRNGRKARIICFDRIGKLPVVALVETYGKEDVYFYLNCGKDNENVEKDYDLMMPPEKKEGWVNVYRDEESKRVYCGEFIFSEREKAEKHYECNDTKVATVSINWEE